MSGREGTTCPCLLPHRGRERTDAASLEGGPARAEEKPAAHHEVHEKCAKACFECSRECNSCAHHCAHLLADGKKDHLKTMALCVDCGTICAAAGEVTGRAGPLSATV